jgi:hypothetical protein
MTWRIVQGIIEEIGKLRDQYTAVFEGGRWKDEALGGGLLSSCDG